MGPFIVPEHQEKSPTLASWHDKPAVALLSKIYDGTQQISSEDSNKVLSALFFKIVSGFYDYHLACYGNAADPDQIALTVLINLVVIQEKIQSNPHSAEAVQILNMRPIDLYYGLLVLVVKYFLEGKVNLSTSMLLKSLRDYLIAESLPVSSISQEKLTYSLFAMLDFKIHTNPNTVAVILKNYLVPQEIQDYFNRKISYSSALVIAASVWTHWDRLFSVLAKSLQQIPVEKEAREARKMLSQQSYALSIEFEKRSLLEEISTFLSQYITHSRDRLLASVNNSDSKEEVLSQIIDFITRLQGASSLYSPIHDHLLAIMTGILALREKRYFFTSFTELFAGAITPDPESANRYLRDELLSLYETPLATDPGDSKKISCATVEQDMLPHSSRTSSISSNSSSKTNSSNSSAIKKSPTTVSTILHVFNEFFSRVVHSARPGSTNATEDPWFVVYRGGGSKEAAILQTSQSSLDVYPDSLGSSYSSVVGQQVPAAIRCQ